MTNDIGVTNTPLSVRRNLIWYATPRLLSRVSAFLLLPVYTRILGPDEFGLALVSLAAGGILGLIVAPGIERVYLYWVFQRGGARFPHWRNVGTVSILHISLLACSMAVLLIWADLISEFLLPRVPVSPFYYILLFNAGLTSLAAPVRASWRAQHRADKVAALELSYSAISVSCILFGLLVVKAGAVSILLGDFFAHIVLLPFYLRRLIPSLVSGWDWRICRAVIPIALVGLPLSFSAWAFSGLDRIFLNSFVGPAEVGIYGAGYQVGAMIIMLTTIFNKEWQPLVFRFAARQTQENTILQELWTHSLRLFLVVGSFLSVYSEEIVRYGLGDLYIASATIIPFIITIAVLQVPYHFLVNFGLVTGRTYALTIESLISVGIFVLASIALIPHFGALGAAWAGVLARVIGCLFLFSQEWNLFRIDRYLATWIVLFIGINLLVISIGGSGITGLIGVALAGMTVYQAITYWNFLGTIRLIGAES